MQARLTYVSIAALPSYTSKRLLVRTHRSCCAQPAAGGLCTSCISIGAVTPATHAAVHTPSPMVEMPYTSHQLQLL